MEYRITVLCENTVSAPGLVGEHGFAAYIETPETDILFDTGQGFGIVPNALKLQKDLKKVSKVVLSHGHFDHTGGLLAFLGVAGTREIVAHPDVLSERFWMLPAGEEDRPLSIGMPWAQAYLTTRGARFQWVTTFDEIAPGVFISGEVPRRTLFELGSPKFVVNNGKSRELDPFLDDFSLFLKTSKGLVVVLGCAHAGIINILEHAIARTGEDRVYAVLGGTHLGLSPEPQLKPTLDALKTYNIKIMAVSHCTGQAPIARLAREFGESFAFGNVGFVLEV
ncbi:MAG: MBL fold metallo-hydrolase [Syntrophobacteraceae bacterium]|nr:MBL fold metallo-hydrolase [Syntrophobacteraceae bacterium]